MITVLKSEAVKKRHKKQKKHLQTIMVKKFGDVLIVDQIFL